LFLDDYTYLTYSDEDASGRRNRHLFAAYRVISFYSGADIPVLLLNVFAKNVKTDLTKAERNEFKTNLAALADTYRRRK
jgi:hypothetical protein